MKKSFLILGLALASFLPAKSQQADSVDYYSLSLEELMNIPINSASKKDETLFDAPLSSYTITKAEIERAGSTSIMEALRLAPGVIVREQANGIYDIHMRGFDNITRSAEVKANLATLVMIDNRPVFNHNLGGTFWETLPIDLNDVERIEIVRGPSAPLFGPNAVTGVINIITRRVAEDGSYANANVQLGSSSTTIANAIAGKDFGTLSVQVSGNYQKRNRFDEEYYLPGAEDYFTIEELAGIIPDNPYSEPLTSQYPDPSLAMEKYGVNAFLTYSPSADVNVDLSLGTQKSEVQKIFLTNVFNGTIPFTVNKSETSYLNLAAKIHDFSFRTSYLPGKDNLALNATPNQYDYDVFDATAEYSITLGKLGHLVPGFSYQSAVYGDEAYAADGLSFLAGEEVDIKTTSGYLRTDLKPIDALRLIAAVRVDKFSSHEDAWFAYELASTYKINSSNLIRVAVTRSNSGSFIGNNYVNLSVPIGQGLNFVRLGTENLDLFTVTMAEFGFRSQITKTFQIDLDVFTQTAENYTVLQTTNGVDPGNGSFVATEQRFQNIPTTATQTGATLSLNFVPSQKLQVRPFLTVQKTDVKDFPSMFVNPDLADALGNPVTYSDSEHKSTPAVFGGYYLNYQPISKLTINMNGYFFGSQRQYDDSDNDQNAEAGDIKGKFLVNLKAAYSIAPQISLFVNGRNLLNNSNREFFGADQTSSLYLAGVSVKL